MGILEGAGAGRTGHSLPREAGGGGRVPAPGPRAVGDGGGVAADLRVGIPGAFSSPGGFPEQPVPPPGADGQWEGIPNLHEETDQAAHSTVGAGCPAPGTEAGRCPEGPEAGTVSSCAFGELSSRS